MEDGPGDLGPTGSETCKWVRESAAAGVHESGIGPDGEFDPCTGMPFFISLFFFFSNCFLFSSQIHFQIWFWIQIQLNAQKGAPA
jgi:hypothetical protein